VTASSAVAADDATVIAESPRAKLTLADFDAEMAKLPPASRAQFAASRARLVQMLDNLYLNRALANDARAIGLDKDPLIARQIALQTDKLLAQARTEKLDRDTKAAFDANPAQYEARAKELYLANPERFRAPESIHVAHILVKPGPDGDAAARAKAEALRARAVAGETFSELAREASDDPSVKRNNGDLGMVPANKLDPAFAKAALALSQPGELSPVVKSTFGYHVIQYKARKAATLRSFDEARAELLAEIGRGLVDSTRSHFQGSMFEPKPKVDEALIDKLQQDAAASAKDIDGTSPAKR
jgi:peptidyl-prolyl cis-trans isomerase C